MPKHTRHLKQPDTATEAPQIAAAAGPDREEIARLAYLHWLDRGCQIGSPEEDWSRDEQDLKSARAQTA